MRGEDRPPTDDTTMLWPGKITAFFIPLSFMMRSGVVSYLFAIERTVSPRFTVCTFNRLLPLAYFSIDGSGTSSAADATDGLGIRMV